MAWWRVFGFRTSQRSRKQAPPNPAQSGENDHSLMFDFIHPRAGATLLVWGLVLTVAVWGVHGDWLRR